MKLKSLKSTHTPIVAVSFTLYTVGCLNPTKLDVCYSYNFFLLLQKVSETTDSEKETTTQDNGKSLFYLFKVKQRVSFF